jgi:hypothetical protein
VRKSSTFGPRDIAWRRLANQRLIGSAFTDALDAVKRLGAVQSQDYAGGKWGIGMRTAGDTDVDVERSIETGTIVRTHVLRPTWHFVAAADIRWMLALTGPLVRRRMATYDNRLELDEKAFARSATLIAKALTGGKHLTRPQLRRILKPAGIGAIATQRLAHLMMRAELDGLVCSGPRQGKQATYALLEERVSRSPSMQREEAMAELARRYFATRGPATVHDFSWWSGLTVSDAKRGIESVRSELEQQTVDGATYWFSDDLKPAKPRGTVAHLLPNYDEYFIGLKDRSAIGELVKEAGVRNAYDAFSANVVAIDGQLVGGWRRVVSAGKTVLSIHLVLELDPRQLRAITAAGRRYGEYLGMPVEVSFTKDRAPKLGFPVSFGPRTRR